MEGSNGGGKNFLESHKARKKTTQTFALVILYTVQIKKKHNIKIVIVHNAFYI